MYNWDYDLPKNWQPKTDWEWIWYIERVVNYGADKGDRLDKKMVKKYLSQLRLDKNLKEFLKFLLYES